MQSPYKKTNINNTAIAIISCQQDYLYQQGCQAHLHFELEGCFSGKDAHLVNLAHINRWLNHYHIAGELVHEYWQNQWEYVSHFQGQTPLQEANYLYFVLNNLAKIVAKQGNITTLIKPVVWSGDEGKLATGCNNIFTHDNRSVHIPNAIQLNISLSDITNGLNLVAEGEFALHLQNSLLKTSLACGLLYLPEEEAFERFSLKTKYGLADELCSPDDISGGYQGSIALYRQVGKHNQKMGEKALFYNQQQQALISEYHWQKTARIEHRLGAASQLYNPYVNVVFALANVIDVIDNKNNSQYCQSKSAKLPASLYDSNVSVGAISLFAQDTWFAEHLDTFMEKNSKKLDPFCLTNRKLGTQLKKLVLAQYHYLTG
jgi:hypothetical protein